MQAIQVDLSQPLLSADDVAGLLGVPRSSIYEYARRQRDPLPSVAIGRHRRFIREDVEAWLAAHRSNPTASQPHMQEKPRSPTGQSGNRRRRRRR